MHRLLYFFSLSAWLLMLEFSVFSVQRLAHTFPTSEIFTKTEVQSIFSFINLSSSTHSSRSLIKFRPLHNNFGFSSRSSSSTFFDFSEFYSIRTILIDYQQLLQIMSRIPLRPSALYRNHKKNSSSDRAEQRI
jgi:hypothetical protein